MTQNDRVLAALKRAGDHGITVVDFLLPDVIDGGPPITRVGARIKDLKDQGLAIETCGTRDKCAVYRLAVGARTGEAAAVGRPEEGATATAPHLLTVPAETPPRCAIFDWDEAA